MNWLRSLLGSSPRGEASEAPLTHDSRRAESRCSERLGTCCRFQISWRDHRGKSRRKNVRVVDMNGDGALIKCGTPIDPGSLVYFKTRELGLSGNAYVRRCEPLLFTYQIGLKFNGVLVQSF